MKRREAGTSRHEANAHAAFVDEQARERMRLEALVGKRVRAYASKGRLAGTLRELKQSGGTYICRVDVDDEGLTWFAPGAVVDLEGALRAEARLANQKPQRIF